MNKSLSFTIVIWKSLGFSNCGGRGADEDAAGRSGAGVVRGGV